MEEPQLLGLVAKICWLGLVVELQVDGVGGKTAAG